jgi:hypothetical protein
MKKIILTAFAVATAAIVAACGGGGGSSSSATTTTISGSAVKGPVDGATVTVKNASTGAVLGTTTTSATGAYTLDVPFRGDVVVEVSGGNYLDEATSVSTALSAPMRVVINANGGSVTGVVTPLTTLAYTYAFGTTGTPTSTAFNTVATNLATQLQIPGVNIATTVPVVTGTVNDYGRLLAGLSTYLQLNSVSLQSLISTALDEAESAQFSIAFTTAYNTANPDHTLTFTFDGSTLNVSGSGVGGGSGTCGVNVQGTLTVGGNNVPLNLNYCINGIAADSCTSGNSSLSQALSGQSGLAGAANLNYAYSPTCVANPDFTINLN